jgi:hypothetical protein
MTNVCIGEVIGKSLDLEPRYMYMIPAFVRVLVHAHESMDIAYIYACVCNAITRRCSRACVHTCASTHVCNAVSESSFRACGRGHAWRESACRAHVSSRVPSLHRQLRLRCDPSWVVYYDYCAAERDNAALTCVPLTQARIAAITYYGPADTCEARARDACACLALPSGRVQYVYVYEYVCAWMCVCECTCACVCVIASSLVTSPRPASPRPSCPPLLSPLLFSRRPGFFSLCLLPLSPSFVCPLLSPPQPFLSLFYPSVLALPSPRFAPPALSPSTNKQKHSLKVVDIHSHSNDGCSNDRCSHSYHAPNTRAYHGPHTPAYHGPHTRAAANALSSLLYTGVASA